MISVHFQGKAFNTILTQVYAPTSYAKEAEVEQFYEDPQDLPELTHTHTHTKRCPFHYRDLECKSRSQEILGVTSKFDLRVQSEAEQLLTEFCQENALVIANTLFQKHKR